MKTDVSRPTTSCFQQRYEFSAPALPLPPSLPPCQSNLTAEPRSRLYNTPVSCTVVVITQVTAGVSYDVTSVKVTQGQTADLIHDRHRPQLWWVMQLCWWVVTSTVTSWQLARHIRITKVPGTTSQYTFGLAMNENTEFERILISKFCTVLA